MSGCEDNILNEIIDFDYELTQRTNDGVTNVDTSEPQVDSEPSPSPNIERSLRYLRHEADKEAQKRTYEGALIDVNDANDLSPPAPKCQQKTPSIVWKHCTKLMEDGKAK